MHNLFKMITLPGFRTPAGFLAILAVLAFSIITAGTLCGQEVSVSIEIAADSVNTVHARVRVPAGTNARDLMAKIFNVGFADAGRKFVKSIAGFEAQARNKEYWSLEIDGKYAMVGIADIQIDREMKLKWMLKKY